MQRKVIIGLALTLIIVIFISVYWAMEPRRQELARERQLAEAVQRGAEIYTTTCVLCHGFKGEGGIGPAIKDSQLDEKTLEKTISRGIPGTAMPALGEEEGGPLKNHQIKDLITFIKNWDQSLIETPTATPAKQIQLPLPPKPPTNSTTSPSPSPTPSAINAGELYANKCAACHGANRQGVLGLAPALTPASLTALSNIEVRDTILNGKSNTAMPSFKGTLSQEEIDALLQFIKYSLP